MKFRPLVILLFTVTLLSSSTNSKKKLIKWEFDNFKKLTYSYTQYMTQESSMFSGSSKMPNQTLAKGLMTITVKNESQADIVIKDIQMKMFRIDSLGDTSTFMTQSMPEMFMQDMKEDGNFEGSVNKQMESLTNTFFPIMNIKAEIGDSVDLPMSVPFNMFGSTINVTGYNRVKYVDSKENIETLKSVIEVSEYDIPEDVKTKYICFMRGDSEYYFDSEHQYFTEGKSNIRMGIGSEPTEDIEQNPINNLTMDMTTTIELKLLKVE